MHPPRHDNTRPRASLLRAAGTGAAVALLCAATSILAVPSPARAQQIDLVRMTKFTPHQVRVDVFTLASPQDVEIDATGADPRFPRHGSLGIIDRIFGGRNEPSDEEAWRGNAWIIDAGTRRVVWELRDASTHRESDGVRTFRGKVHLAAGTYEAYYASYSAFRSTANFSASEHLTAAQIAARTHYDDGGASRSFRFSVRGVGEARPAASYIQDIDALRNSAIVSLTGLRAGETKRVGIVLDRPAAIDVSAIGELREDESFDYGWIINADTHEPVWTMEYANTRHGGGSSKNREAHAVLNLPAGRYAAAFTLDDSHDGADWNAPPPHDPGMWGLTLRTVNAADRAHVRLFDYSNTPSNAIVALTGIGDDQNREAGFTLHKPMSVRIHALGEGDSDEMNDYGWITEATTHRTVWSMKYSSTRPAGGSDKNRVASQVVTLPAGSYVVHYRTDGSHSAAGWNTGTPMDGDMWGITVWPTDASQRSQVAEYDPQSEERSVIAKLAPMSDDEDARRTFHLDRPTDVRIYAIGEGRDNTMFDRGFIEERGTKRVVWEMKFGNTTHAGGAAKNRAFNGVVRLDAGDYVLRWVSDDSHSADGFNETAPEDPGHWGITLYSGADAGH